MLYVSMIAVAFCYIEATPKLPPTYIEATITLP